MVMPLWTKRSAVLGALVFGIMSPVFAQETWNVSPAKTEEPPAQIRYDFDRVKAVYGLNFQARPQTGVSPDSWIAQLAGGPTEPITVLFGAVYMYKDGQNVGKEHFLKVEGKNGSRRFLENSLKNTYAHDGDSAPSTITQFFWSAKQLEGETIVKNFEPPIISTTLWRDQNPAGGTTTSVTGLRLGFSNDGNAAAEAFWNDKGDENAYVGDMTTLEESTDPCVSSGHCLDQ